ncbi:hypothetical protein [Microbacterium gilvum]|uniref:Uncharacterized protein n=1 Tax=Microbacterium gilvum TaxID=1336204 RepID=A0ABP9A6D4_9MICO
MTLVAMIEDGFPHGTVEGFRLGCKGSICPAPLSCAAFSVRYRGDYAFAKAVDGGESVESILAREKAAQARPVRNVNDERISNANQKRREVRHRHEKGWTDRQIAADMGETIAYVGKLRRQMELPVHPDRKGPEKGKPRRKSRSQGRRRPHLEHGTVSMYTAKKCRKGDPCPATPSCHEVAMAYKRAWLERTKEAA